MTMSQYFTVPFNFLLIKVQGNPDKTRCQCGIDHTCTLYMYSKHILMVGLELACNRGSSGGIYF